MFDVLGFSKKLADIRVEEMNKLYQVLAKRVNSISGFIAMVPNVSGHIGVCSRDIDSHYFSDTFILWTKALSDPTARLFTELVSDLICDGIEMNLPLRGTITYGDLILDKPTNTFIGEPIIEAHNIEVNQDWIGVSFGKSVSANEARLRPISSGGFL